MSDYIVLYSAQTIRDTIRRLSAAKHRKRRRVICVAFVGADCLDFLENVRGADIYCWPQPGGTSSDGINRLLGQGANVRFMDRLHSKVYWTDGVGCLVTSANLSRNALGDGGLVETGVFFADSSAVDIDAIVQSRPSRPASNAEILELARKSSELVRSPGRVKAGSRPVTIEEWYSHRARRDWKLAWCGDDQDAPKSVEEKWSELGASEDDSDWAHCRPGEYKRGDWLLVFDPWHIWKPYWMYVTHVIKKREGEEDAAEYPYSALQVGPAPGNPPFSVKTPFAHVLHRAVKAFGRDRIKDAPDSTVSPQLLTQLVREWRKSQ